MALGAMASQPHSCANLKIIPMGINYFRGHRFRSRVFVDVGVPFTPSKELVDMFRDGKEEEQKEACRALMAQIKKALETVTVKAPNFQTLQFFRFLRRMYRPTFKEGTSEDRHKLMCAFSKGYDKLKEEPEVKSLQDKFDTYSNLLRHFSIPDHRVEYFQHEMENKKDVFEEALARPKLVQLLLYRVGEILIFTVLAFPGILMAIPMILATRWISSRKQAQALKGSMVKIEATDVVATWKVLISLVLVPLMHVVYTTLAWVYYGNTAGIAWFFFAPAVAAAGVLASERVRKVFWSIRSLVFAVFDKDLALRLVRQRMGMQHEVRRVIHLFDWDETLDKDLQEPFQDL